MMKFSVSHHAQMRIDQRQIPMEDIKQALKNGETCQAENAECRRWKAQNKYLKVIFKKQKRTFVIITAYYEN